MRTMMETIIRMNKGKGNGNSDTKCPLEWFKFEGQILVFQAEYNKKTQ